LKSLHDHRAGKAAILILKLSCFFLLAGRAYQHLFWDIPLRTFFWDEGLLKPLMEALTGSTWQDIVTSKRYDLFLISLQNGLGIFYGLAAIAVLFAEKLGKRLAWILPVSSFLLFLLTLLYFKDKFFYLAQFFEYSVQITAPLLLYFLLYKSLKVSTLFYLTASAVAATFIAHGLFALNFYPLPGTFIDMTISILRISESQARIFLMVMGWLDVIFAVGLFVPIIRQISLYYCVVWGFLTAAARLVANVQVDFLGESIHQYGFEMTIRLVHGGLPLFLLLWAGMHLGKRK
jgi:hypothetical protein